MSLTAIIIIILVGILLVFVEFFIIPGISIAGSAGFLFMGGANYAAFHYFGPKAGFIMLFCNIVATVILLAFVFRSKTWKKVGLATEIDGKFTSFEPGQINIGDIGIAITRLAPGGKVMVNDIICEAKSRMEFIDENTEIEVVKVENTKIIVKLKNDKK